MGDYGFEFLKSRHREQTQSTGGSSSSPWLGGGAGIETADFGLPKQEKRSLAERQADVVDYLLRRLKVGKGPATITEISDAIEVDLRKGKDDDVLNLILANPKVETVDEEDPLKETGFVYIAKYAVTNEQELLQLVNRCKGGICWEELKDTYHGVERDVQAMREGGRIIAVENKETHKMNLYPRGELFLSKLPGKVKISSKSAIAMTQEDMNVHIRRGEAVRLGELWFRVSSETVGNQSLRSRAPLSVTADKDMSARNVYVESMGAPPVAEGEEHVGFEVNGVNRMSQGNDAEAEPRYPLPINGVYGAEVDYEGQAVRHGCSKALRDLWRQTKEQVPTDPVELHRVLFKKRLISSDEGISLKRPKKKAPDGSAKRELRRLQRKAKRHQKARAYKTVTNTHLEGTELGRLLAAAGQESGGGDRGGL